MATRIDILTAATATYGEGADYPNTTLSENNWHNLSVISGEVSVSYKGPKDDTLITLQASKTPADLDDYHLKGIRQFSMTAVSDSVVVINSWKE